MKNNNDNTTAYFLIFMLFVFFYMVKREDKTSKIDDLSVKITARERLKSSLKDPGSLEIISERIVRPGKNGGELGYEAVYRAKNSFGGYVINDFYTE
jgi:hypothetical protein